MEIIVNKKHLKLVISKIQDFDFYKSNIDKKYIQKAQEKFKSESRILEWLNTHYLIKMLTSQKLTYYYNNHGAPYLEKSNFHLSIAHSENYSALLLSDIYNIGLDLEEKERDFTKASSKFVHEEEKKWTKTNDDYRKIWCFKEAAYKMFQNASPSFSKEYNCLIMNTKKAFVKVNHNWFLLECFENENYFVTWCYNNV